MVGIEAGVLAGTRAAFAADDPDPGASDLPGPQQSDWLVLARRTFPGDGRQLREARLWLAQIIAGYRAADAAGDVVLAMSEFAANAVSHSDSRLPDGTFTVRLAIGSNLVRVEVIDQGGVWHGPNGHASNRGRGLMIVAALAAAWGIRGDQAGRTAWCELGLAPVSRNGSGPDC